MSLRSVQTLGPIIIKIQSRDNRYYLVYRNTAGKRITQSTGVVATTDKQIQGGAPPAEVLKEARTLRDVMGSRHSHLLDKAQGPGIKEALDQAIKHTKAKTDERRADLKRFRDYFTNWMKSDNPGINHWEQITGAIVLEYVEYLHDEGLKPKSIGHYIGVLTLTANHWNAIDPARYHPLRIKSRYLDSDTTPAKNYLDKYQTAQLFGCAYLRANRAIPRAIAIGCYAGCNIKEIIRLQVQDFDFTAGLLTIRESKNKYRHRTIPLLPALTTFMQRELAGMAPESFVVTNTQGFQATHHSVGLSIRRLLNSVATDFNAPAFAQMDPKDIRKTLVNLCVSAGIGTSDIGNYVGHSPTSMTERHYAETNKPERLQRVVIEPLQAYLLNG